MFKNKILLGCLICVILGLTVSAGIIITNNKPKQTLEVAKQTLPTQSTQSTQSKNKISNSSLSSSISVAYSSNTKNEIPKNETKEIDSDDDSVQTEKPKKSSNSSLINLTEKDQDKSIKQSFNLGSKKIEFSSLLTPEKSIIKGEKSFNLKISQFTGADQIRFELTRPDKSINYFYCTKSENQCEQSITGDISKHSLSLVID